MQRWFTKGSKELYHDRRFGVDVDGTWEWNLYFALILLSDAQEL
jgi:hypothetical protein